MEKNINEVNFDDIFKSAKESTVYAHAMVWIKEVLKEEGAKRKTDREQFIAIQKIVNEAQKHL